MKNVRYPGATLPPAAAAPPEYARPGLNLRSRAQIASIVAISVGVGLLLSIVWSFEVADGVLGATIADTALGADARNVEIGGPTSGIVFAFVAGLAATFTACNCVVFSCVAPLAGQSQAARRSLPPLLGWMTLGVLTVTIAYGVAGAIFGHALPMLSSATLPIGEGYPVRLAQSTLVFVALGIVLVGWGLADLRRGADAPAAATAGRAWIKPLCLGLIIGGFTVGRPFPLFRKAFEYAAETGNPLFSAAAMALQGLGNIALIVALLLALTYAAGGRAPRWLGRHPQATVVLTAASLIVGGVFLIAYWGLRVPSIFGIGWFPRMPYN